MFPDRIEFVGENEETSIRFAKIARPQDPQFRSRCRDVLGRLCGVAPTPRDVADNDWFHAPANRFLSFYSSPPIKVFMPADEAEDYATSYFLRIQAVMRSGGYSAFDLG